MVLRLVHKLSPRHVEQLHELYQTQWWTRGRSLASVQSMVRRSDSNFFFCLIDPDDNDNMVGFTRVLSDCVYKALIFDVIVKEGYRKRGLGVRLMESLQGHPELSDVKHFELYCHPDMVQYHKKLGFTDELSNLVLMRKG